MLNRRQAVVGYLTYRAARRIARRRLRRGNGGLRPGTGHDANGGNMLRRSQGTADRAAALVETVRPIVAKAMNDPELHEALRRAFNTGREVSGEFSGTPPREAARRVARDRKLRKRVEGSAVELQKAVSHLVEQPKKTGRIRRTAGRVAVIGTVAGGAIIVLRRLRGGGPA